jgi:primosomal protein N'
MRGFMSRSWRCADRASLPPFGRLAALIVSDSVASRAEAAAKQVRAVLDRLLAAAGSRAGESFAVAGSVAGSAKDLMAGVEILRCPPRSCACVANTAIACC